MTLPFDKNIKFVSYIFLWVIYAFMHVLSLYPLVDIPLGIIIIDGCIHAIVFGFLGILLWNVLQYGKFSSLPFFQRIVNYAALAILSVGLWVGVSLLIEYFFFDSDILKSLSQTLLLKTFVGFLIYILIILVFKPKNQLEEQEELLISEEPAEESQISTVEEENIEKELIERIAVKIGQKIHVVPVSDIFYFQSYGDYVQIITEKDKFIKEQTMKYFETNLPAHQFVRVHRSYIVNVEAISRIEAHVKQNQLIILKNGDQLKVSASGYKTLRAALNL